MFCVALLPCCPQSLLCKSYFLICFKLVLYSWNLLERKLCFHFLFLILTFKLNTIYIHSIYRCEVARFLVTIFAEARPRQVLDRLYYGSTYSKNLSKLRPSLSQTKPGIGPERIDFLHFILYRFIFCCKLESCFQN